MNAVAYIRLSNQDQSNYSVDSQKREIFNYCTKYNLTITDTFTDNGESSYTFDRADFKKLEIYIKKYRPQYIIVYHLDRFSRNLAEALQKTRELLTKYNVRVRDVTEPLDLDDSDPNTFMIRSFRFMMAENELHRIRQRIKAGMLQGALNGRHLNAAPYGYKNGRDANNKPILIIDEEKAFHIQLIFKEFNKGNSIEETRRIVKLFGYTQKSNSAIQRVLTNIVYIGKIKVPGNKIADGLHTPIVTEYDFYKAAEILQKKKPIVHQSNDEVFLRGVLKDASGNLMTAGNSRGRGDKYYWYYVSKFNRQNFAAKKLHQQFFDLISLLKFSSKEIDWFKNKLLDHLKEKEANQNEVAKKLTIKLQDVKTRIEQVEEKYLLQPDISAAVFKRTINALYSTQTQLQEQLLANKTDSKILIDKLHKILPYLNELPTLFNTLPTHKKQQFIRLCFDNSLSYYNEAYRTAYLHPIFQSKAALAKEKGLLFLEQPLTKLGVIPIGTADGNIIQNVIDLFAVFAA